MNHYLRHILLPVIVVLAIFFATCLWNGSSAPTLPEGIPWDKIVHFAMFFTLSGVCYYDYYMLHNGSPNKFRWFLWCFVLPVFYGGAVELAQEYLFPARSAEWADFFADIAGSLVATIIAYTYLCRNKKLPL